MKRITAFIFARGGSKGLPGKNSRLLSGKPLIGWSIEQALAVSRIERVIVSTDSQEIANIAKSFGAQVPFLRPASLATDTAAEIDAWRHALNYLLDHEGTLPDIFVSVPATSPLRLSEDIDECINTYEKNNADLAVVVTQAHRNPWFNMVKKNKDQSVSLINSFEKDFYRRQDAPEVFDLTTVAYAANPSLIIKNEKLFSGRVFSFEVPKERAIDIDTLYDFEIAEFLMDKRLKLK
ncbi:acylneuraminate cytidylyltransferase family protein [Marinospirillum sp. MEB164]|uniref:Acylneuraminate cytidylyltransferase family protein n=1 Tax=Marinospirillum alkalitolerans TaxID=3123374 RepID=A0ABW8PX33_9GAMM